MRIDMVDFNSESRYVVYKWFYIGDEIIGYWLYVEDYEGMVGILILYCIFVLILFWF